MFFETIDLSGHEVLDSLTSGEALVSKINLYLMHPVYRHKIAFVATLTDGD